MLEKTCSKPSGGPLRGPLTVLLCAALVMTSCRAVEHATRANAFQPSPVGATQSGQTQSGQTQSGQTSGQTSQNSAGASSEGTSQGSTDATHNSVPSSQNGEVVIATVLLLTTVAGIGASIWAGVAATRRAAVEQVAHAYFKANARQFRQDLAMGAGYTVEDLAAAAEIRRENLGRFGRVLHNHRLELLELAEPSSLTPERAAALLKRIGELAGQDALLARDRDAFLARTAQES